MPFRIEPSEPDEGEEARVRPEVQVFRIRIHRNQDFEHQEILRG